MPAIQKSSQTPEIQIIGVPMDLGQTHRGVDMGPSAMRYAGLSSRLGELGHTVTDNGNIDVPIWSSLREENRLAAIRKACGRTYRAARKCIEQGVIPLFLGGDHSISIGTIGGVTHTRPCGVIWIDAHGDFNLPETSRTGNIHGMTLAVLTGRGRSELTNIGRKGPKLSYNQIVLVGVRDLDPGEKSLLRDSGIMVFTMRDIDETGISVVARKALAHLERFSHLHISLDMDILDPMDVPGVGTPVPGGLTYREAHLLMEIIADTQRLASMDIVEINPILDHCNHTAQIAVALAVSGFGKCIL